MIFWFISSIYSLYEIYNKCKILSELNKKHYNQLVNINPDYKELVRKTKEDQVNEIFYVLMFIIMYLSLLYISVYNIRII